MSPRGEARKRDRLSALRDDLLHRVLLFLDARQPAAVLSLLSRRWRHLWATTPYVALSDAGPGRSERFGSSLLLLCDRAAALRAFRLDSRHGVHVARQRRWLRHALGHDLRVLELVLSSGCPFHLPDRVFNCATLEELTLSAIAVREVIAPKSVRLPLLKKLHLFFVTFGRDPSAVEKLNSGCLALEDLSLSQCKLGSFRISFDTVKTLSITDCEYSEIHVSAPNTRSLRLTVSSRVQLEFMPSMVSAWVYFCGKGAKHLAPYGHALLAALRNVQHLELFRFSLFLQLYDMHNVVGCDEMPMDQKPSEKLMKVVPALHSDIETLRFRVSKSDDMEEFSKMRGLLKETTKPRDTVVVWL